MDHRPKYRSWNFKILEENRCKSYKFELDNSILDKTSKVQGTREKLDTSDFMKI